MRVFVFLLLFALFFAGAPFPVAATAIPTPQCPFTRGFNLAGWFQATSAQEITNSYTMTDLENMMALGADHVRVPIDLDNLSGGGPSYLIDPILFLYLDRLVDWTEDLGLYIILDYHPHIGLADTPDRTHRLIAYWRQMAEHFKERSDHVLYELHNEPFGLTDNAWGDLQRKVIDAIRAIDTTHTLIVAPNAMSHFDHLAMLPDYTDNNLIYTFHFYDPFLFTHQGTNWTDPSMANLTGVPYPYDASRMPVMPIGFAGTWLGQGWGWYPDVGTRVALEGRMDIPARFAVAEQVPIHCGELGVWAPGAPQTDRVQWYADIRSFLEADGIAWTMWGYKGGFGIYQESSAGSFPADLDVAVVDALGLSVPSPLKIQPDTSGMMIYDDLVGSYLFDGGHGGTLDIYDGTDPEEGDHCLHWTGAQRYSAITWRFTNPRDLSQLNAGGYRIRFWMKTDSPRLGFDLRFVDTDLGDGHDHPWRMVKTIDNSLVTMDGQWHEVEFPLSDMTDAGSWDDNAWYGSEGKFDWTCIDRIEIVAEHQDMLSKNLWIDNMQIVAPTR